jgi:hypothetical protein
MQNYTVVTPNVTLNYEASGIDVRSGTLHLLGAVGNGLGGMETVAAFPPEKWTRAFKTGSVSMGSDGPGNAPGSEDAQ